MARNQPQISIESDPLYGESVIQKAPSESIFYESLKRNQEYVEISITFKTK